MSSVQRQPNGRWKARVRDLAGDRTRTFDTEAEARAWLPPGSLRRGRRRRTRAEVIEVLASRFDIDEHGCWVWNGLLTNAGYGRLNWMHLFGVNVPGAHRVVLAAIGQPVPQDKVVDHLCRNRACINPDHLDVVTQRENVLRSPIAPGALNAAKTHCAKGHPYDAENTYTWVSKPPRACTVRICRTCQREYGAKRYAARRLAVSA